MKKENYFSIINKSRDIIFIEKARIADTFLKRVKGLMFKKDTEEALIFYRAPSIHTFFMRFNLDVIFLDRKMRVIRIIRNLKPARMVYTWRAWVTIEIKSGVVSKEISEGDCLEIKNMV